MLFVLMILCFSKNNKKFVKRKIIKLEKNCQPSRCVISYTYNAFLKIKVPLQVCSKDCQNKPTEFIYL